MPGDPKLSRDVWTNSGDSAKHNSGQDSSPEAEPVSDSSNRPSDVDELVSSFLIELNTLSDPCGQAEPKPEPISTAALKDKPIPELTTADTNYEEALPLESEVRVDDLDVELARVLDELEKVRLGPVVPVEISKTGVANPSSIQAAKVPEPAPGPPKPARVAVAATAAVMPAAPSPLPAENKAVPAPKGNVVSETAIFKSALPPAGALRRIHALGWAVALILLLGGATGVYYLKESRTAQPQRAGVAASNTVTANPAPDASTATNRTPQVEQTKSPAEAAIGAQSQEQAAAKPRNPANTPVMRSQTDTPASATSNVAPSKPEREANAEGRPEPDRSYRQPAPQTSPVQASQTDKPAVVSTSPPPANPAGDTSKPTSQAAAPITSPEKPPAVTPTTSVTPPVTPPTQPPVENKPANAAGVDPAARPAPTGSTAAQPVKTEERAAVEFKAPEPAVAIKKVLPIYPLAARRFGVWGTVNLNVEVDEKGRVISAVAVNGPALLRPAAEDAVKQWQFKPASREGVTLPSTVSVSVTFNP